MSIDLERGLHAGAIAAGAIAMLFVLFGMIRWAKRHKGGAAMFGATMVLLFGSGLVPRPPQEEIEEARKARKDDDSGDPPDPEAP